MSTDYQDFKGKLALITGSSRGIGAESRCGSLSGARLWRLTTCRILTPLPTPWRGSKLEEVRPFRCKPM